MKKLKNIEDLDALFKQQLDKAEVQAPDVWANVSASVGAQSGSVISQLSSYFSSITNIVKVALFVGGVSTAGVLLYNANTTDPEVPSDNTNTELVLNEDGENTENLEQNELSSETESAPNTSDDSHRQTRTVGSENEVNSAQAQGAGETGDVSGVDRNETSTNEQADENNGGSTPPATEQAIQIKTLSNEVCIGSPATFTNSKGAKGNWFIDGEEVKKNSEVMSHIFDKGGEHVVLFKTSTSNAEYRIKVVSANTGILVKDLGNGQYELSLANSELKVKAWYLNGGELSTSQVVNARLLAGPAHIMVSATDGKCEYIESKKLDVASKGSFSSPTVFTPDNDGYNDEYYVDIKHYQSFVLQVFDASNRLVFQTSEPTVRWNGKINNVGAPCASGVYIVKVSYQLEGEKLKSELIKLTLKR